MQQRSTIPDTDALSVGMCVECGDSFDLAVADAAATCPACFQTYLNGLEIPFLEQYARFGAKAHRTVAEALFRSLVLSDVDDRKVMGMRIVEEYLNAAAGLMALHAALWQRTQQPIVETFLDFRLTPESVRDFQAAVTGRDSEELLADLDLPTLGAVEAARPEVPQSQYRQFRAAVEAVATGLTRVQRVEQSAVLALAGGMRESRTLTHTIDWIPDQHMNPDQVALLVLEHRRRMLLTHALAIHETQLEVFIDAIDKITNAARDLIWLYLHVQDVTAGR